MIKKVFDKKIFDELLEAIKEAGNKDNRAALNALDLCAEICGDFLDEDTRPLIKSILFGRVFDTLDFIRKHDNPYFKEGDKLFKISFDGGDYLLKEVEENIFLDAWGTPINAENVARISRQEFTDVWGKGTIFKISAIYINGSTEVLGFFGNRNECDAYYEKVAKAFGF